MGSFLETYNDARKLRQGSSYKEEIGDGLSVDLSFLIL